MKQIICLLVFIFNAEVAFAQTFEADISLTVTSEAFSDGISQGESGLFNLSVTNLGPNSYPEGSEFGIGYAFKINQDTFIIDEFFDNNPVSSDCEFVYISASPRPPDDNNFFTPLHYFEMTTALDVGQTANCQISLLFEESGYLETRWRVYTGTDSQTNNNEAFFVFRGTPQPVPININLFLIVGFLCSVFIYSRKAKIE
jgi:hypothetical protein